jgi:hypothetical protein
MSDAEVSGLLGDLAWGLPQMSGGTLASFASVSFDTSAAGNAVLAQRDGAIVFARFQGLAAATGYAGFGRWATRGDGTVTAGVMLLDADEDRLAFPQHRALRTHELGHALGYNHVLSRPSVMNADATLEPTDFDRDATRIGFERPPGSQSPDVDPTTFLINSTAVAAAAAHAPAAWSPAVR